MPRILLSILVLLVAQHATAAQPAAKKAAPAAKIVVVQPQADQQVTATAEVRIKVEVPEGATAPTAAYVGLGGAPSQEQRETERFAGRAETSFVTAIRRTRVRAAMTALIITAVMGTIIFVLWVGANQVHAGNMTGGQLASFVLYAVLVAGGVGNMAEVWGDVMRAAGATERLLELLHARPTIPETQAPQRLPQPEQAAIRFDHVTFRYPARLQTAALDNITLNIAPGETMALVGPSGAGKTTLFQLLLRFYDVTEGCGTDANHPELCARCAVNLDGASETRRYA